MQLLTAINRLFLAAGERTQLTSLTGLHPLEEDATFELDQTNRTVQARGWWFNTYEAQLTPDVDGRLALPTNVISFEPRGYRADDLIQKGNFVYDKRDRTDVIGRPIKARIVEFWEFSDLPETFAQWITAQAEFAMASNYDADPTKLQTIQGRIATALVPMHQQHIRNLDVNMLSTWSMNHKLLRSNQYDRYRP